MAQRMLFWVKACSFISASCESCSSCQFFSEKHFALGEFISWALGGKAAVERKDERPNSRQHEWTGFGNRLGGKGDVVEFDPAWSVSTKGRKIELPSLPGVWSYIGTVDIV